MRKRVSNQLACGLAGEKADGNMTYFLRSNWEHVSNYVNGTLEVFSPLQATASLSNGYTFGRVRNIPQTKACVESSAVDVVGVPTCLCFVK